MVDVPPALWAPLALRRQDLVRLGVLHRRPVAVCVVRVAVPVEMGKNRPLVRLPSCGCGVVGRVLSFQYKKELQFHLRGQIGVLITCRRRSKKGLESVESGLLGGKRRRISRLFEFWRILRPPPAQELRSVMQNCRPPACLLRRIENAHTTIAETLKRGQGRRSRKNSLEHIGKI